MDRILKSLIVLIGVLLCVWLVASAIDANAEGTCQRKTIEEENVFTDAITIPGGAYLNVSIESIDNPEMVIYLQCQYLDMGETRSEWRNVDSWTVTAYSDDQINRPQTPEAETIKYRMGCPSGNYTSGSLGVRLGSWQGF